MSEEKPQPPATKKTILGIPVGDIFFKAVIPVFSPIFGVLGVALGYYLNQSSIKEPHLTVSIREPVEFSGKERTIAIHGFQIKNDGTKEAEDIDCELWQAGKEPQEIKLKPDNIKLTKEVKGNGTVAIHIPRLNPNEALTCSFLSEYSSKATVNVSAKGILGEPEKPKPESPLFSRSDFIFGMFCGAVGLGFFLFNCLYFYGIYLARKKASLVSSPPQSP